MTEAGSVVFVVDGDPSVRRAIKRLVKSVGLQVELFGSAYEFLRSQRPNAPSCLALDIRLPGTSGLDLQRELLEANIHISVIFITAHWSLPPIATWPRASPPVSSVAICFIGSTSFLSACRRSENASMTFPCWCGILCRSSPVA